jgi:prepilin-type N-terminal cleavage/methylation domain-containing protein
MCEAKGFTLLEFLIVVTILALSVSIIYPNVSGRLSSINTDKAIQDIIFTLKTYRWEAFSKKERCEIFAKRGRLWVKWGVSSPRLIKMKGKMVVNMEKSWICLPNGAVTETVIEVMKDSRQYKILVSAVEGKVKIERVR